MVTTITKTIKPSGGDYSQPQDAYADIPAIVGSADLVTADTAVVFLMDRGEYDKFECDLTDGLTTDATRNITFKAANGHDHGGKTSGGVRIVVASGVAAPAVTLRQDHVALEGLTLVARQGVPDNYGVWCINTVGNIIKRCVILADGQHIILVQANATGNAAMTVIENCLAIGDGTLEDRYIDLRGTDSRAGTMNYRVANCSAFDSNTFIRLGNVGASGSQLNAELLNNFSGNCTTAYATTGSATITVTGGGNIGGSTGAFPSNVQAGDQTWDITTNTRAASDGNTAIYDSGTYRLTDAEGNDAIHVGVSPSDDSDVPATDIVGKSRGITTTNVGAFQRLKHIWTDIMATSRDSVDVLGVLKMGASYINAKQTVLTTTGPSDTDDTPMIPAGTTALWIQQISATGAGTDVDDTCILQVHIDESTSMDLLNFGTFSVPTQNSRLGFFQLPIEVTGTDGTYPFIRMSSSAGVESSETFQFRIVAIGESGPSWS